MTDISAKTGSNYVKTGKLLPTLKTRKEFIAVRSGKRHVNKIFTLQAKLNESPLQGLQTDLPGGLRVGYVITGKVGNSVVRNRIKRRLKHALPVAVEQITQRLSAENNGKKSAASADLVLIAKRPTLQVKFATLVGELTIAIDRLVTKGNKAA